MVFWSLACASHGLATSVGMLAVSRLLLGMGEGGGFPAATRAVAEWFPVTSDRRRWASSTPAPRSAASIAPPLLALVITSADWRAVFYLTGVDRPRLVGLVVVRPTTRPSGIRGWPPTSGGCSRR